MLRVFVALIAMMAAIGCDTILGIENTSVSVDREPDAGGFQARKWILDPNRTGGTEPRRRSDASSDGPADASSNTAMDSGAVTDSGKPHDGGNPRDTGAIAMMGTGGNYPIDNGNTGEGDGGDDDGGVGGGRILLPSEFSGLVLWLDAARGVTTSGLGGNKTVGRWYDQSGHGNDAAQNALEKQPRLLTGAVNNLPAVEFNGHSSFLSIEDSASLDPNTDDFVIVMVAAWDNVTAADTTPAGETWGYAVLINKQYEEDPYGGVALLANAFVTDSSNNTTLEGRLWGFVGDSKVYPYNVMSATEQNDGRFRAYGLRRTETTTIEARVNGAVEQQTIPGDVSVSAPGRPLLIGGHDGNYVKQFLSGAISEIVIIRGSTSNAELEQLERYLNRKYQLWK